ncbi:Microtubule-destabilizing protein 60 [Linum perenne]
MSENSDPNVSRSSPMVDSKSGSKSKKPGQKITPNSSQTLALYLPRNKLKERKFVVAKKKNKRSESRKEGEKLEKGAVGFDFDSDFANVGDELGEKLFRIGIFWNGSSEFDEGGRFGFDEASAFSSDGKEQQRATSAAAFSVSDHLIENSSSPSSPMRAQSAEEGRKEGSSTVKRRREKFLEEARKSVPECGKRLLCEGFDFVRIEEAAKKCTSCDQWPPLIRGQ